MLPSFNNVSKLRIFLSIFGLEQFNTPTTSVHISKMSGKPISQTGPLLNRYFKFHYIDRSKYDKKSVNDTDIIECKGCRYRYHLLKKGKRTLRSLVMGYKQGLNLDLMDKFPNVTVFDSEDTKNIDDLLKIAGNGIYGLPVRMGKKYRN